MIIMIIAIALLVVVCGAIDYQQMAAANKEIKKLLTGIGKTQVGIMSDISSLGSAKPTKLKAAKAPKLDLDPIVERIAELEQGQGHIVEALNALVDQLNSLPIESAYIYDDEG